nr:putative Polycomb group protein ASXL2 isoform X2 [Geotrypetes seraphini]XP_033792355.1 putative Polycomb group protein ASXL2 isoform X2 [Geotrypetes seraphini]XP_033792356.1 putative Polycomb group protein ASXL2 isoform X2 [Geotrypetes seraphini]XP_033792357.1 putative Polycomb group protein ASXL2 isoform X2 [Geotrypetes seraphini]XP_033792358.1 putative Polycomb group protein ASXL2 isoform X2 [Geotrypetes seraphini]
MLHTNSRGEEGIFYKVPGRMGVYTLKKDTGDEVKELYEVSEESSDVQSDSQSLSNSSSTLSSNSSSSSSSTDNSNREGRRSRWKRKVPSRLSQPSSPQSGCSSPSISAGKVISPSQKHSKKALKQALKQQHQKKKQQHRRAGMPVSSNPHILLKAVKTTGNPTSAKTAWEGKQPYGQSSSPQNSSPSPSVKADNILSSLGKKASQHSDKLQAKQLKKTKCAEIDVETPDSILVNTNLRALINKHTFSLLPGDCQQRLLLLLPEVDRQAGADGSMKLSGSALNNEFFTSAAQGWKERLSEGEFTPEMQLRIRQETEKEKKVDPWKEQFYESYYGQNSELSLEESAKLTAETTSCLPLDTEIQRTLAEQLASIPKPKVFLFREETKPSEKIKENKEQAAVKKVKQTENKDVKTEVSDSNSSLKPFETDTLELSDSPKDIKKSIQEKNEDSSYQKEEEGKPSSTPQEYERMEQKNDLALATCKPKSPEIVKTASVTSSQKGNQENDEKEASASNFSSKELKRKSEDQDGTSSSPEKKLRVTNQQIFRSLPKSFHEATEQESDYKVKIACPQILSMPFPGSQVSPGVCFPPSTNSPGRTGARTLADIKAKAQLARAQRAAAAAAAATAASFGGTIPGPGPGGGGPGGGETSTASETNGNGSTSDLGRTGRGGGSRRSIFHHPKAQLQAEMQALHQTSAYTASRAQLQQTTTVQSRPTVISTSPILLEDTNTNIQKKADLDDTEGTVNPVSKASFGSGFLKTYISNRKDKEPSFSIGSAISSTKTLDVSPVCNKPADETESKTKTNNNRTVTVASDIAEKSPSANLGKTSALISSVSPVSIGKTATLISLSSEVPITSQAHVIRESIISSPLACSTLPAIPSLKAQKDPSSTGGFLSRASSNIPANNPLVTQLLQGKDVPLEQIMPKPLTKGEMKTVPLAPAEDRKLPTIASTPVFPSVGSDNEREGRDAKQSYLARQQLERILYQSGHLPQSQRILQFFAGKNLKEKNFDQSQGHEAPDKATQEQILQTLIKRAQGQNSVSVPHPAQLNLSHSGFQLEDISTSQRFMLGFVGRRTSKPAMSGHYLLNISTYGRVLDSFRRAPAMNLDNCMFLNGPDNTDKMECRECEREAVDDRSDDYVTDLDSEDTADEHEHIMISDHLGKSPASHSVEDLFDCYTPGKSLKLDALLPEKRASQKPGFHFLPGDHVYDGSSSARGFFPAAQVRMANVIGGGKILHHTSDFYKTSLRSADSQMHQSQLYSPLQSQRIYGNTAHLIGPAYGGTISVSTSPDVNHGPILQPTCNRGSDNTGNIMSFSVTVTTIPTSQTGNHGQPISVQAFTEDSNMDDSSKCYCRLKAMIMCKGCGAFCHDECIGPSKLCVSCLVVR